MKATNGSYPPEMLSDSSSANLLAGYPPNALAPSPALPGPSEATDDVLPTFNEPAPFDPEKQVVAGGQKMMYLEGLRGLAAFFVANGHFVDAMFRSSQPEVANFRPFNLLW
jgi:hypothetical protein